MNALMSTRGRAFVLAVMIVASLGGCESMNVSSLGKRIDYKSPSSAPSLELPPDLTTPRYDDRYAVTTASGLAAARTRTGRSRRTCCPPTAPTRGSRAPATSAGSS